MLAKEKILEVVDREINELRTRIEEFEKSESLEVVIIDTLGCFYRGV